LMDGFCGASEDRMRSMTKPTPLNFMHFVNVWASGIMILGVIIFGEAPKFLDFVTRHPEILENLGLAVLVGAFGQIFISSMVANFGPLPLSIVTTTRKFFSVFLSVILFKNSLSIRQWSAAGIIFGALFLDAIFNKKIKVKPEIPETEITNKKTIEISVINTNENQIETKQ
jgi:solute carrier family 35 (UDP-galactose transporter), member B1